MTTPYYTTNRLNRVRYNGVKFPEGADVSVSFENQYDDATQSLIGIRVSVAVSCILADGDATSDYVLEHATGTATGELLKANDLNIINSAAPSYSVNAAVEEIRKRLSIPRGDLEVAMIGLGEVLMIGPVRENTDGMIDINKGPLPEIAAFERIGEMNAVKLEWSCTATVPPTSTLSRTMLLARISSLAYSVNYTINDEGWCVRSITGSLSIPILLRKVTEDGLTIASPPRLATGNETENALAWCFDMNHLLRDRDELQSDPGVWRAWLADWFPPLRRFKRSFDFTIEDDKSSLSFTITDTEHKFRTPLHTGIIENKLSLEVGSDLERGFTAWDVSLDGTVRVQAGWPKWWGWKVIIGVIEKMMRRLNVANSELPPVDGTGFDSTAPILLMNEFKVSTPIIDNELSITLKLLLTTNIEHIFLRTGFFTLHTDIEGDRTDLSPVAIPPQWNVKSHSDGGQAVGTSDAELRANPLDPGLRQWGRHPRLSDAARMANRANWQEWSDWYQAQHGPLGCHELYYDPTRNYIFSMVPYVPGMDINSIPVGGRNYDRSQRSDRGDLDETTYEEQPFKSIDASTYGNYISHTHELEVGWTVPVIGEYTDVYGSGLTIHHPDTDPSISNDKANVLNLGLPRESDDPEAVQIKNDGAMYAGATRVVLTVTGTAVRVGLPPVLPHVIAFSGIPCRLSGKQRVKLIDWIGGSDFDPSHTDMSHLQDKELQKSLLNALFRKKKVFALTWRLRYIVLGTPTVWGTQSNLDPRLWKNE